MYEKSIKTAVMVLTAAVILIFVAAWTGAGWQRLQKRRIVLCALRRQMKTDSFWDGDPDSPLESRVMRCSILRQIIMSLSRQTNMGKKYPAAGLSIFQRRQDGL